MQSFIVVCLGLSVTLGAAISAACGDGPFGHCLWKVWMYVGQYKLAMSFWFVACACALHLVLRRRTTKPVYLLDFSCFKPRDTLKCNYEVSEFLTRRNAHKFYLPSMDFQRKIFNRSGLGEETCLPEALFKENSDPSFTDAQVEAEDVLFGSVRDVLSKSRINPQDISILVTNCSLHTPNPSYSSMIVNHFKLREDCKTFHLSGMGCSASLIACKLAADLLRTRPNQYALVVSTENITLNWYTGNVKPMLVTNCLFRVGCAAMVLTNKQSEKPRCKYEFLHCIRTHKAAEDKAYGCAYQMEDDACNLGVALSKNLMGVAADALRVNIRTLGPLILPLSEQLMFVFSLLCRHILKMKVKQYQPDFKLAVEHICLHAGGRAVIDEIESNLFLDDYILEPSRCTLHRWGNTSSSSLWYVLAYMEAKERIKAGDKVWMLGLGSGFKCNSAIWKAISDIPASTFNVWSDCVHRYPACQRTTFNK